MTGSVIYDYRKDGLRFRLYPDGSITVSSKDLPERSLYQLERGDFSTSHKSFNSLCCDGIRKGDVDDVLSAQARISKERGMKRNAGVELYDALEQIVEAAPSSGPLWHGSEQIVEARAALAKARGE